MMCWTIRQTKPVCLLCLLLLLPFTVKAGGYEIPLDALLGNKKVFFEWRSSFQKWYQEQIDSITGFVPSGHEVLKNEAFKGLTLLTVQFNYPAGSPLAGKSGGGVLAIPDKVERGRPLILAIHGHEHSPWGKHPIDLFKNEKWPFKLTKRGYVVWAPISMYHDEIKTVAEKIGYPFTWVKIVSDGINYGQSNLWTKLASSYVVAGLSSGGQIAYTLMAYRPDIRQGIFAGADQDLDFLRREYRIKGHPNCWDIVGINSYTAVQALLAPRPIQFQSGRKDPFFPSGKPMERQGDWFSGTSRAQFSTEPGGNALVIRSIYEIYNNRNNFSFFIHDGGHEINVDAALKFIQRHSYSTD
jgi:hypothetical protein